MRSKGLIKIGSTILLLFLPLLVISASSADLAYRVPFPPENFTQTFFETGDITQCFPNPDVSCPTCDLNKPNSLWCTNDEVRKWVFGAFNESLIRTKYAYADCCSYKGDEVLNDPNVIDHGIEDGYYSSGACVEGGTESNIDTLPKYTWPVEYTLGYTDSKKVSGCEEDASAKYETHNVTRYKYDWDVEFDITTNVYEEEEPVPTYVGKDRVDDPTDGLSYTEVPYCGDGVCDMNAGEQCWNCKEDCWSVNCDEHGCSRSPSFFKGFKDIYGCVIEPRDQGETCYADDDCRGNLECVDSYMIMDKGYSGNSIQNDCGWNDTWVVNRTGKEYTLNFEKPGLINPTSKDDERINDSSEWIADEMSLDYDKDIVMDGDLSAYLNDSSVGSPLMHRNLTKARNHSEISFWYRETDYSNGHGVSVRNPDDERIIGVFTDNPQLEVWNGSIQDGLGSVSNDTWYKYSIYFSWEEGTATVYHSAEGELGTFKLANNWQEGIKSIHIENYHSGFTGSSRIDGWIDNIHIAPEEEGMIARNFSRYQKFYGNETGGRCCYSDQKWNPCPSSINETPLCGEDGCAGEPRCMVDRGIQFQPTGSSGGGGEDLGSNIGRSKGAQVDKWLSKTPLAPGGSSSIGWTGGAIADLGIGLYNAFTKNKCGQAGIRTINTKPAVVKFALVNKAPKPVNVTLGFETDHCDGEGTLQTYKGTGSVDKEWDLKLKKGQNNIEIKISCPGPGPMIDEDTRAFPIDCDGTTPKITYESYESEAEKQFNDDPVYIKGSSVPGEKVYWNPFYKGHLVNRTFDMQYNPFTGIPQFTQEIEAGICGGNLEYFKCDDCIECEGPKASC